MFFVIGALILFVLMFSVFLILPFFLFLAGIVAMMVSDRRRSRKDPDEQPESERVGAAELLERDQARRRGVV
ncbi:MAG: hypothetical protein ACSLFD_04930 [Solirubrobacterales bacterium]